MSPFVLITSRILSFLAIILLVASFVALYAAFSNQEKARMLRTKFGKWALPFAFAISLIGTLGSLFYSEVAGFNPCDLCWIQRAFFYPQTILLGASLVLRKRLPTWSVLVPAILGGLVALYHAYAQLGGQSILPCTAEGGSCMKVYFIEWGFITLPGLSATVFIGLIAFYILAVRSRVRGEN